MRQTIITLTFILTSLVGYSQSSTVGFIPATQDVVLCTDNINLTTEYSPFGMYTIYDLDRVTNSTEYSNYFPRTFGVNVALFNNGINFGGGVSVDFLPFDEYEVYPDFLVRVHPLKMLTQENRMIDISLMINFSKTNEFGIGISIPTRLNALWYLYV